MKQEFSPDKLEEVEFIDEGSESELFLARDRQGNRYCVKKISGNSGSNSDYSYRKKKKHLSSGTFKKTVE